MINELGKRIFDNAVEKGFWEMDEFNEPVIDIPKKLMLIVSELSEAMEADRKHKFFGALDRLHEKEFVNKEAFLEYFKSDVKDTFEDELADAAIRLFDLCYAMDIDLEYHIKAKMKYNASREYMHGGKKY